MFGLFRKKKKQNSLPELFDLNEQRLHEGDEVMAHRYELGKSVVVLEDNTYFYRSVETGKMIRFNLMIDATTQRQKVEKIQRN
ncbi:hypothetical protein AB9P05_13460 [Roseivirga sp. BDSF3-8]|uniref:hypothetical protein n=1 Tax=Roseivirga sp. BDSF3-8 TaxID=3241598 RepID=UPI0035321BC7